MLEVSHDNPSGTDFAPIIFPSNVSDVDEGALDLLLIEPDLSCHPDKTLALTEANYRVTTVRDIRELFPVAYRSKYFFALLSESLGAAAVDSAARFVRTQWPAARILFIGSNQRMLEDHLYDERIEMSCNPSELQKLLTALDRQKLRLNS